MKPVLVTTQYRGVFFGNLKSEKDDRGKESIRLFNVRNCIYWASNCGGFWGLAANGPTKECRIGTLVPEITLYDITSVTPVTDKGAKAWIEAKTYGE